MKNINFSHFYHKLEDPKFPTVRGKNFCKNKKIVLLDKVNITVNRFYFCSTEIYDIEIQRIEDLPTAFLIYDGSSYEIEIESREQYIQLLNSFIPKVSKFKYSEKSEVCIIHNDKISKCDLRIYMQV